jgi:hypothetical protein
LSLAPTVDLSDRILGPQLICVCVQDLAQQTLVQAVIMRSSSTSPRQVRPGRKLSAEAEPFDEIYAEQPEQVYNCAFAKGSGTGLQRHIRAIDAGV